MVRGSHAKLLRKNYNWDYSATQGMSPGSTKVARVNLSWTLSQLDLRPAGHYIVTSTEAENIFRLDSF
jgi:hypothetical protein